MHTVMTRAVVPARPQRRLLVGVEVRVTLRFDQAARQRVLWSEPVVRVSVRVRARGRGRARGRVWGRVRVRVRAKARVRARARARA